MDVGDDQVGVEPDDDVAHGVDHHGHVRKSLAPVERGVGILSGCLDLAPAAADPLDPLADQALRGPHDALIRLLHDGAGRLLNPRDGLGDLLRWAAAQRQVEGFADESVQDRRWLRPGRRGTAPDRLGLGESVGHACDDTLVGDAGAEADHGDAVSGRDEGEPVALGAGVDLDVVR